MAIKEMHFSCSQCNASVFGSYIILLSHQASLGFCSRKCIIEFLQAVDKERKSARTEPQVCASPKIAKAVKEAKLRQKRPACTECDTE